MKICKKCGTENDDNLVFCKMCGEKNVDDEVQCVPKFFLQGDERAFVLYDGEHIGANDENNLNKYLSNFPNISKNFCLVSKEDSKWFIENISSNNWFMVNNQIIQSGQKIELENMCDISFARVSFKCEYIEDEYQIKEVYYIPCRYGQIELQSLNEVSEKCTNCPMKSMCDAEPMIKEVKIYAN